MKKLIVLLLVVFFSSCGSTRRNTCHGLASLEIKVKEQINVIACAQINKTQWNNRYTQGLWELSE